MVAAAHRDAKLRAINLPLKEIAIGNVLPLPQWDSSRLGHVPRSVWIMNFKTAIKA